MLGVGEALKREIAGLVLVGSLLLWGLWRWACLGCDLTDLLIASCQVRREGGLTGIFTYCAKFCWRNHLLLRRQLGQRIVMGSQVTLPAAECGVGHIWGVRHAAAFCVFGGALACLAGAIVSTIINCPPQQGQGSARTRGGLSAS